MEVMVDKFFVGYLIHTHTQAIVKESGGEFG